MTAGQTNPDVLSRVRRERRMHGKRATFSGIRIVLTATAITLGILLFAFGAIGMLMLARSPQEPIASKLDPLPPSVAKVEPEPAPAVVANEQIVLPAPEAASLPTQSELEKQAAALAAARTKEADPETTATVPNPPAQQQPAQVQQQNNVRRVQPQNQQQAVRRPAPKQKDSQSENPLFQLFGIRQYR